MDGEASSYRVNGQGLVDSRMRTLQAAIWVCGVPPACPWLITADADAAHQYVVRAMDTAGQMGFVHLVASTHRAARRSDSGWLVTPICHIMTRVCSGM